MIISVCVYSPGDYFSLCSFFWWLFQSVFILLVIISVCFHSSDDNFSLCSFSWWLFQSVFILPTNISVCVHSSDDYFSLCSRRLRWWPPCSRLPSMMLTIQDWPTNILSTPAQGSVHLLVQLSISFSLTHQYLINTSSGISPPPRTTNVVILWYFFQQLGASQHYSLCNIYCILLQCNYRVEGFLKQLWTHFRLFHTVTGPQF